MAANQEPGVRGDVPGRLYGTHDSVWLRRVLAQIPRDAVQPREESGQRFHWLV